MEESIKRKKPKLKLKPTGVIVLGFAAVILIGALLLALPFATKGGRISFIDALFTSASATCVTGLVIGNTFSTFTVFGQIVIIILIQFGGLGFLTLSSAIYLILGKKMTLSRRLTLVSDNGETNLGMFKQLIKTILRLTAIIEGIGAVILTLCFLRYYSFGAALCRGLFHSISAFCNAGFDIIDIGAGGMAAFSQDPIVLLVISFLIILGGLGFIVIGEVVGKKHYRRFSLHTKVVLCVTGILLLVGTILTMIFEYNNAETIGNMSFGNKLVNSFFQSVTTRTAGFNSVDMASLSRGGRFVTVLLMFVGASPASTGGGVKTTTLFVMLCALSSVIKQRKHTVINKQIIGHDTVSKASSVLLLAMATMVVSLLVLLIAEPTIPFEDLLFEQVSAYATVGLSVGVTAQLGVIGKLVLIFNIFLGRIGALTFFVIFAKQAKEKSQVIYPEANIII